MSELTPLKGNVMLKWNRVGMLRPLMAGVAGLVMTSGAQAQCVLTIDDIDRSLAKFV